MRNYINTSTLLAEKNQTCSNEDIVLFVTNPIFFPRFLSLSIQSSDPGKGVVARSNTPAQSVINIFLKKTLVLTYRQYRKTQNQTN